MLGGSAALAAGAAARPALAAPTPAVSTARDIVRGLISETHSPSMSAAVTVGGELVWAEAFGVADLDTRVPATVASRYRLASVSKLIAAATAARLAQRGDLELDWPLARYRPGLPEAHRETTLRQLLAHTGGVRHYIPRDYDPAAPGGPIDYRPYPTTADALAVFIHDPLLSAPGEAFNYSTFGYTLASAVMESATGRRFPDLVAAEISGPLGLPSLFAETITATIPDRVACYQSRPATGEVFRAPAINPAYKWAGGGYVGTASDVARFCAAFARPGFLEPAMLDTVFTPVPPTRDPAPVQVGLGWRIDRDGAGRLRAHHAGSIAGGRSIALLLPEAQVSVAVLSNLSDRPVDPLSPAQRIAEAFLTA